MDSFLEINKELIENNNLIDTKNSYDEFAMIMTIYKMALNNASEKFISLKQLLNDYYNYDVITNVTSRLKSPNSIVGKMQKKKIEINYENMIQYVNDIAGVRIVCTYKDDIYKIRNIIRKQEDIKIIKEKDYIKKAKKSGYSAYHIIVEIPIELEHKIIPIKVEIQIRTIMMDFWATTEHKIKYKAKKKLSNLDSMKLSIYAKIINIISDKIMKMYRKQIRLCY